MLFANSRLVRVLTEVYETEHRRHQAAKRKIRTLEQTISEQRESLDCYSLENAALQRKLSLSLTGEEKEKLLRENEQLEKENAMLKRGVSALIRMNEFLHNELSGMTKELADGKLRKANDYLLTRIATLEKEKKALAQSVAKLEAERS